MASLTTVYIISIILTSIAGMGSAFVGNKIYPLSGGSYVVKPEAIKPEAIKPETIVDPLEETIMKEFNMDAEFAKNVVTFIKTPVTQWNTIASDPRELKKKFMRALTHPNLNKCPPRLLDICKIVNIKYSNMADLINGKSYTPYGDQSVDAAAVLSGNR